MTTATGTTSQVTHRSVQVRANFERYAFMFMRISGVALLVLAVGHMMIQHVLNSSTNLTIQFVAAQWNTWGWKVYDMFLLVFAIAHGFNGLRTVLEDFIHDPEKVKVVNVILLILVVVTIIWAAIAIAAFDPSEAVARAGDLAR